MPSLPSTLPNVGAGAWLRADGAQQERIVRAGAGRAQSRLRPGGLHSWAWWRFPNFLPAELLLLRHAARQPGPGLASAVAADELIESAGAPPPASITDINIQAGEDPVAVREIVLPLVRAIRAQTPLGISVCLGNALAPRIRGAARGRRHVLHHQARDRRCGALPRDEFARPRSGQAPRRHPTSGRHRLGSLVRLDRRFARPDGRDVGRHARVAGRAAARGQQRESVHSRHRDAARAPRRRRPFAYPQLRCPYAPAQPGTNSSRRSAP